VEWCCLYCLAVVSLDQGNNPDKIQNPGRAIDCDGLDATDDVDATFAKLYVLGITLLLLFFLIKRKLASIASRSSKDE
jgi:hypothetical protein